MKEPLVRVAMCQLEEHVRVFLQPSVYIIVEGGRLRSQVLWVLATSSLVPGLMLMLDGSMGGSGPVLSSMVAVGGMIVSSKAYIFPSPTTLSLGVAVWKRILLG